MGEHKGYRIVPTESGTWRAEYRVAGRYRSKCFDAKSQATAWAQERAAEVGTGKAPAVILRFIDTAAVAKDYLARLLSRGRSMSHRANVARTLALFGTAVPDLAADDAHRRAERWLDGLRLERIGRHKRRVVKSPSPGYRNRVVAEVQAFCRWAVRQERIGVDPSRTLERATITRPIKPQFSVAEVRQLCAPCADHPRQRWVALMLLAGLRSDEAAALTWADVQGGQLWIRAHPGHRLKRGKERLVPLQPALASILGPAGTGPVAPLPGSLNRVAMGRHLRALCEACGIVPGKRTPHSCRHTYGALMIATGCPSILVQAYMGHESVTTTADYARAAPLHVADAAKWGMGVLLPPPAVSVPSSAST